MGGQQTESIELQMQLSMNRDTQCVLHTQLRSNAMRQDVQNTVLAATVITEILPPGGLAV